ncbi:MAG TPA: hypothetical protein VLH08_02040, partial [Acidobacteriota bacterium]|nr:hypothetical protein [Acidobacteriota bacterium]
MPAYVLVLLYSFMALSFPDRWNYLLGLLLALVLYLGIWRLGRIISSSFIKLKDETIFFPLGLGIFLLITYFAAVFSTGVVMYFFWIAAAILAIFEIKILFKPLSRHFIWAMPFLLLGFWSTLTPSVFFDALVYHLGLPMQFSISGRMETLPFHFFSTFPPFEFVLNLLLVKLNALSGIKVFSILIIFHIAYALIDLTESLMKDEGASQFRSEFVVLPVFFLASLWIQVHLITADLLVAMFLVCSICSMVKNRVAMDYRHLL